MKVIRAVGDALLWVMAVIGALTGVLWIAHAFGLIQPLVVVSESMQPAIRTGDLLVAFPVPVEDLAVGDIASLPSTITGNLITHRIIDVATDADAVYFEMQGDDNDAPDAETYEYALGDTALHPVLTIPRAGSVLTALGSPMIGIPLFVAIVASILLTVLPSNPRKLDESSEADEQLALSGAAAVTEE
ncbi:signal peptidase I [Salinibacterium sp. NSLL150]|uniref:signal peptidase I n=1 Tax=unclassified Salinibacterium TaxID=2632331 RepID=UPI0018CD4975|nr:MULTISPECIES: signal peptidase I [unclassified Salinibacterium]MBH0097947.1 signal peptidase I [Salinibacterium sp. NSLL35]MBH0100702.1 signal peptidase I [Salinibacterium sp. NSLL150]MBH0103461.1 signal peptidase I [Salinibacterium sp. NSLL16]MBH0106222.1 signal peptidase I [Salinibacterium sp. NSLL17]